MVPRLRKGAHHRGDPHTRATRQSPTTAPRRSRRAVRWIAVRDQERPHTAREGAQMDNKKPTNEPRHSSPSPCEGFRTKLTPRRVAPSNIPSRKDWSDSARGASPTPSASPSTAPTPAALKEWGVCPIVQVHQAPPSQRHLTPKRRSVDLHRSPQGRAWIDAVKSATGPALRTPKRANRDWLLHKPPRNECPHPRPRPGPLPRSAYPSHPGTPPGTVNRPHLCCSSTPAV